MAEPGAEQRMILEVRDLQVYYGAFHVLQGVDIAFARGIHAVLGRNGMGKTTLCNAIMGLIPSHSGSIRLDAVDITGMSPDRIAALGIGYTPQGRRLWPSLTVDEHLRLIAEKRGGGRAASRRTTSSTPSPWTLERIYDAFPRLAERRFHGGGDLSGGEQQMLAIARALLPGPRLLVMDEPSEGLAPVFVEQMVAILRRIEREEGVSVLLVEQNLAVATALAEDVSIMVNGRISSVLPAEKMAADGELQRRLLGVGRHGQNDRDAESEGGREEKTRSALVEPAQIPAQINASRPNESRPNESRPQAGIGEDLPPRPTRLPFFGDDYMPPPRWSPEKWRNEGAHKKGLAGDNFPRGGAVAGSGLQNPPARVSADGVVIVAGTFDTKGQELNFLRDRLHARRVPTRTVDLSTSGKSSSADVSAHQVAAFHPRGPEGVMTGERGSAVAAMAEAFADWSRAAEGIVGMISAAGSGGTALVAPAMRALPVGVAKLMISTVASGDVARYVGASDIMMMYSVTDVQGINRISARILANGADAVAGMVRFGTSDPPRIAGNKPALGLTMFGVTTPAVQAIVAELEERYECLVFHATGTGGRSMEKLADNGLLSGVLDITTTEVCDMMMGGVMAADEDRFGAFIRSPIAYVGSVGALDMVNWGAPDTIPARYADRLFHEHNPQVTLMRTTAEENGRMGEWIAERLNQMQGEVRFLLPLGGVSSLDAPGGVFHDPQADAALFDAIRGNFISAANRKLLEVEGNINDAGFVAAAVKAFEEISAFQGRAETGGKGKTHGI